MAAITRGARMSPRFGASRTRFPFLPMSAPCRGRCRNQARSRMPDAVPGIARTALKGSRDRACEQETTPWPRHHHVVGDDDRTLAQGYDGPARGLPMLAHDSSVVIRPYSNE